MENRNNSLYSWQSVYVNNRDEGHQGATKLYLLYAEDIIFILHCARPLHDSLTTEEVTEIKRLAASRKEPIRLVQRARIIAFMLDDPELFATEAGLKAGFTSTMSGALWVQRFNQDGIAGLQDKPRPGRKPTHPPKIRSALISLATQKPDSLGYPFKLWTLERLQIAFEEREHTHLSDSTIWEWVEAEGFRWKRQQSWFHNAEQHDPEFVEKRGASSQPISTRNPAPE